MTSFGIRFECVGCVKEICANPQLFVDGASRMDVVQGIIGKRYVPSLQEFFFQI